MGITVNLTHILQPNILVDDSGRPRITDFGLATVPQNQAAKRPFLDDQGTRWAAPEILHESGTYSKEADVFSFAMVMIEVRCGWATTHRVSAYRHFFLPQAFTGAAPFGINPPSAATVAIMRGDRLPRPTHPDCSDEFWALIRQCWHQKPHERPKVSEVFQAFPSSILDEIRSLHEPRMASHEFQLALCRFYGSPNYQGRIDSLQGSDLKKFVDFLDNVRHSPGLFHSNPCFDIRFRYYGRRG